MGAGAPAEPPDATWINRIAPSTAWSANGGLAGADYVAQASGSDSDGAIGSTAGMVADVQAWVDGTADNFGWILIGDESTAGSVRGYGSRENSNDASRPALSVEFEVPTDIVFEDGFEDP